MARRAPCQNYTTTVTDVPGVVFAQIDGLGESVLRVAHWHLVTFRRYGAGSTMERTDCLHGRPSGRRDRREPVRHPARLDQRDAGVPGGWTGDGGPGGGRHPKSALAIEQHHSDGNGLLSHNGSSYGNLYTGDAQRAVLTMSVAGRVKEGRLGAGYRQYFSRPSNAVRTFNSTIVEVLRERRDPRPGPPRCATESESNWTYASCGPSRRSSAGTCASKAC